MDKSTLNQLGEEIRELLREYDFNQRMFSLQVDVPHDYYETIKDNFDAYGRQLIDAMIIEYSDDGMTYTGKTSQGVPERFMTGRGWSITITRPLQPDDMTDKVVESLTKQDDDP